VIVTCSSGMITHPAAHFYNSGPLQRPQTLIIYFKCTLPLDIQTYYKLHSEGPEHPVSHGQLKNIPVSLDFPSPAITLPFIVCHLPFVYSRDEQQRFTSQRGVVFCLLRSSADTERSLLLLNVNISHAVMNVRRLQSRSTPSALTSHVYPLSSAIYSYLCLGQRCAPNFGNRGSSWGKYQPQQRHRTNSGWRHLCNFLSDHHQKKKLEETKAPLLAYFG